MHTLNFHSTSSESILSLDHIRAVLQRLEDTIVFHLIERAQFAHNPRVYQPGAFKELEEREGWKGSWVEWFIKETESTHAKVRRFEAPDEYPFTPVSSLPKPILPPVDYPSLLQAHEINVNQQILRFYKDDIVPSITRRFGKDADDGQYGSAAVRDVEVLAALSRRIHFGMFVSESKFRSDPASFIPHILNPNRDALAGLITKPAVEAALLVRLAEKAKVYGQDMDRAAGAVKDPSGADARAEERKIEVEEVVRLYKAFVIPLTKEVEVDYLLVRLNGLGEEEIERLSKQVAK